MGERGLMRITGDIHSGANVSMDIAGEYRAFSLQSTYSGGPRAMARKSQLSAASPSAASG